MVEETFYHELISGEKAKFTISSKIMNEQVYYFANVVGIDIDTYKNLTEKEKQSFIGVEVSDGMGKTVFYKDKEALKTDIIDSYGTSWLVSEI